VPSSANVRSFSLANGPLFTRLLKTGVFAFPEPINRIGVYTKPDEIRVYSGEGRGISREKQE
jgi:hypothetical protein